MIITTVRIILFVVRIAVAIFVVVTVPMTTGIAVFPAAAELLVAHVFVFTSVLDSNHYYC